MATAEQLNHLKASWLADPIYDLEDAEGFEEHREELLAYRIAQEQKWERERQAKLQSTADRLGISGNLALAQYILTLEQRLDAIEGRLNN